MKEISLYLEACKAEGMRRETIRDKKRHLGYFKFDLQNLKVCDIYLQLNKLDKTETVKWKIKRDIRSFLKFCNENGYCSLPFSAVKNKPPAENIRPCITYDEYIALRCYSSLRYKQVFDFLWQTGIRIGELVKIDKKTLDQGKIKNCEIITEKTGRRRTVYFTCDLSEWIDLKSDRLFPTSTSRLRCEIKKIRLLAGLKRKITAHSFRHSFITRSLDKGCNVQDVAILAGHTKIQTTMNYYHLTKMRQKYEKYKLWE